MMTKQVALADATYQRLRMAKQPGESFSDVIERLLGPRKDPMDFLEGGPRLEVDPDALLAAIEEDRDAEGYL